MQLDIRWPIGLMFALTGAILAVYGVASDPAIYVRSLGINVNLWWGLVMVVFGSVMLLLAWRAHGAARPAAEPGGGAPDAGPPKP
jgi:protein-S-isoprenylcysteine O-methyltransferase Ste14